MEKGTAKKETKVEKYNVEQACNIIGINGYDRAAYISQYQHKFFTLKEWQNKIKK